MAQFAVYGALTRVAVGCLDVIEADDARAAVLRARALRVQTDQDWCVVVVFAGAVTAEQWYADLPRHGRSAPARGLLRPFSCLARWKSSGEALLVPRRAATAQVALTEAIVSVGRSPLELSWIAAMSGTPTPALRFQDISPVWMRQAG